LSTSRCRDAGTPRPSSTGNSRATAATAGAMPCTTMNATSATSRIGHQHAVEHRERVDDDVLERTARHVDDPRHRFVIDFRALERIDGRRQQTQDRCRDGA
jgi:hypothetical protein